MRGGRWWRVLFAQNARIVLGTHALKLVERLAVDDGQALAKVEARIKVADGELGSVQVGGHVDGGMKREEGECRGRDC